MKGHMPVSFPLTIRRILKGRSPVTHGDGLQTRDCTYVTDTADAALKTYYAKSARGKVLNIASGKEMSIKNISKIAELMNCRKPITYAAPRPWDVCRLIGSNALAKKLINYEPRVDFDEGLRLTIDWYRNLYVPRHESTSARAEKLYRNLLALPMCHSMTKADQEYHISEPKKRQKAQKNHVARVSVAASSFILFVTR
jgi:dTDP-D-glucose 4,6-dehydratase